VVTIARGDIVKLHFHTTDRETTRRALEATGALVSWSEDDLTHQVQTFQPACPRIPGAYRYRRRRLPHPCRPATLWIHPPGQLYHDRRLVAARNPGGRTGSLPAHASGERVTTSQASVFERHQHYQRLLQSYPETLYLCVGSAFTGNYAAAAAWQPATTRTTV
jgi:hypothetical protein